VILIKIEYLPVTSTVKIPPKFKFLLSFLSIFFAIDICTGKFVAFFYIFHSNQFFFVIDTPVNVCIIINLNDILLIWTLITQIRLLKKHSKNDSERR
jgi:hypothetical protein